MNINKYLICSFIILLPLYNTASFTPQEYRFYVIIRKIADTIFQSQEAINNDPNIRFHIQFLDDFRATQPINPRYDRTTQGLFLEFCAGIPATFLTPWGRWCFLGQKIIASKNPSSREFPTPDEIQIAFLQHLSQHITLELDATLSDKQQMIFTYKIHNAHGLDLPKAIATRRSFLDVQKSEKSGIFYLCPDQKAIRDKWQAMNVEYQQEKPLLLKK